jgi:CHAT domain-containing protein
MEHHGFPSEETLAAFIDGRLDVATHKSVLVHLNACDDCYAIVLTAPERGVLPRRLLQPPRRLQFIAAVVMVLVVAAIAAVAIRLRRHEPLAELAAHLEHRRIESRIAGFRYLPYEPPQRDGSAKSDTENWDLMAYAATINNRVQKDASPKNLHDLAVSHLVFGTYDEAVAAIELALTTETREPNAMKALAKSKDATLLSDASAIYLARAKARRIPADSISALEAAERAWKLAQRPEIAWNRALATESQHVIPAAIAAWDDYLRLDPKSPWAAEARMRIAKLRTPTDAEEWQRIEPRLGALAEDARVLDGVVGRYAQQARMAVEESLLPAWGNAELAGDTTRGDERLATAREVAASLRRVCGTRLDEDDIRLIEESRGAVRLKLARGHAAYGAGRKLFDGRSFEQAGKSFRAASSDLEGTPFSPLVTLHETACRFMDDDYIGTSAAAADLETVVAPDEHPLRGKIAWIHGLAEVNLGHPDRAIELYRVAEEHFKTAREDDNLAVARSLIADAHESVGDSDAAMPYRMSALSGIARTGATARRNVIMAEAAYAAMSANRNATAQVFLLPLMNDRSPQGGSLWRCTALIWSSSLRAADGDREGASRDIQRARATCGAISDESVRQRTMANMTLAETAAPSDRVEAMRWLNDALSFFRESRNPLCIAELLDRRGREQLKAHDEKKAESDFREAVAVIESERDLIAGSDQRDAFLASAGRIYTDLVDLLLEQQCYIEAFEIVERSRSGDIAHSHHGSRKPRPHTEWLRSQLPSGTVIVEYVLRGDSLITWLISADDIGAMRTNVSRERLAALSERAASTRDASDLAKLHELLVAPWAKNVASGSTIVFVPDPALERVPFAALLDRKSGRYLADDFAAAVAPSALAFVANAMEYRERSGDRALLVADPTLDPSRYATLPPLDGARDEVSSVARFYPNATSLIGDAATKESFLRLASSANVIHFAGHAIANDAAPRYSALLFGESDGGDGRLYVGDLPAAGLAHVRLAVLSACSTARGSREKRGSATLARAFLSAGVPAVVGTLWPVDDEVAAAFSRVFHQSIQKGRMPATALREAQISMLKSPARHLRDPSSWAAFRLLGAATTLKEDRQCPHCGSSSQASAR